MGNSISFHTHPAVNLTRTFSGTLSYWLAPYTTVAGLSNKPAMNLLGKKEAISLAEYQDTFSHLLMLYFSDFNV